jgi:hypothetical protein
MTDCAACGKPLPDTGRICHACSGRLRRQLLDIPALLAELDTTALRQAKTGTGQGAGGGTPWNEHARQAQAAIRAALTTWTRTLTARTGQLPPARPATWLADETNHIRLQPWADDMAADIHRVTANGWRAIDRPEDRWYAGPCGGQWATPTGTTECAWTLWARIDQTTIGCPQCGTSWAVDARREWLLAAADNVHETAPNIASALTIMLRTRVSPATIRKWASRGDLTPIGDRGTARLYRVGDVITLIHRRDTPTDTPPARQELTTP